MNLGQQCLNIRPLSASRKLDPLFVSHAELCKILLKNENHRSMPSVPETLHALLAVLESCLAAQIQTFSPANKLSKVLLDRSKLRHFNKRHGSNCFLKRVHSQWRLVLPSAVHNMISFKQFAQTTAGQSCCVEACTRYKPVDGFARLLYSVTVHLKKHVSVRVFEKYTTMLLYLDFPLWNMDFQNNIKSSTITRVRHTTAVIELHVKERMMIELTGAMLWVSPDLIRRSSGSRFCSNWKNWRGILSNCCQNKYIKTSMRRSHQLRYRSHYYIIKHCLKLG